MKLLSQLFQRIFRKKVLIVDDEQHIRDELGHFLRKKYCVFTAATRQEAIEIIKKDQPHFVIIDLNLDTESEYSGLILLAWLVKTYPAIKPLILSAYTFEHVRESDDFKEREEQVKPVIEQSYISKGARANYIETVTTRLEKENE